MMTDEQSTDLENELADGRFALFTMADGVDSAHSFLGAQLAIADEIIRCEAMLDSDEGEEYRWHIHMLRLYVDGLAWGVLHPFTIRQLAKNPTGPPRLSHQLDAFRQAKEAAEECVEEGVPVLICDLTHCLRMGDVLVCRDPEVPQIVECKSAFKPEFIMRGRTGRQLSRAMETLRYLRTGVAKVHGEDKPRRALEPRTEIAYTWDELREAVSLSQHGEVGVVYPSEHEVICVYPPERELEPTAEVRDRVKGFRRAYGGFHTRVIDDVCCRLPPPFVWPLPPDVRFSLLEGDTVVVHMIDVERFLEVDTEGGSIRAILDKEEQVDGACFLIEVEGEQSFGGAFYLDEVIYSFQTIESTAQWMVDASRVMLEEPLPESLPESSGARPAVHVANTLEELVGMASENGIRARGGYLMMPMDVFEQAETLMGRLKKRGADGEGT